jgi:tRNA threonylcarbamoyladenosine biosynthesis protein TsaE
MNYTLKELKIFVKKISIRVKIGTVIYLRGELGTGKTTLTKCFIENLFQKNKKKKPIVTSPTFNIVQYYLVTKKFIIAHYDLYRLKKSSDINNIGLYDLEDKMINIIEWPELIKKKHKNRIEIILKYTKNEDERNVSIKYFGTAKR